VVQESLFYGFSLEGHVPQDHLLRSMIGSSISAASANTCGLLQRDGSSID